MIMILTSMPVHSLAANVNHNDLSKSKSEIINNITPVKVAKPEAGKMAADLIKNPDQPKIYTLRTDYKVQRGEKYQVDYQPYIASVGASATQAEKDKVNKPIVLPDIAGYKEPQKDFTINYKTIKDAADEKNATGNDANGIRYSYNQDFKYDAKSNSIKVKHVFQNLEDFTKYTNPDGSTGDEHARYNIQRGNTGSTMQVKPLDDSEIKGFIPEAEYINMQVPENAENFILEYRYNRAHYDVVFDTQGGTPLPARTLYYEQVIPKIADESIPTKVGGEFQGWKPSVDLKGTLNGVERTFKANEIIKVGTNEASKNLDANLIMPANKVTFTAVWKDKEKADYAVQFWAEKADHADGASLLDKYDYMGTRVYKDQKTGSRPNLDIEPVNGLKFPDLDQKRLDKIWAGARFNRGRNLFLNKFFVYNKDLTHNQNKDPANVDLVKSVDATGKTVYNIYYDRQVYDLYFTKSNAQPEKNTIYPEIWGYDTKKGKSVMLGGPGKPYHYKARFNEMMYKWPNDAKQTKGFTPGYQSFGWGPNYTTPNWPTHLDTPPYRLNADEFLDMENYTSWGGYTKNIDKGDGTSIDLNGNDFTTLSFGIKQDKPSIPHHMDFWMDGFKKDETIIRYDLVRTKADTAGLDYGHRYPKVTGFTPYGYEPMKAWPAIAEGSQEDGRVDEDRINGLNDERDEITPNTCGTYYNNYGTELPIGQLDFISVFFSDSDEYGDVKKGGQEFTENGYLKFKYKRNKYPLRFNYDPSIIRDDSYFNSKNQLDTFYEFPLKALSPDVDSNDEYKKVGTKEGPKNLLDNPENLQKLGLSDLVFTDSKDGKLKVKRPEGLSDQMVFKGWALDPAGTKLIWENPKETMPFHPLNLYAKWGEPDYQWKVTFDPNGGKLSSIDEAKVTQKRKTIQVGDKGQEETKTFAKKEKNDGDKQVFTVIQRQKLVEPKYKPTRKGYDFMGWEVIRYKKDAKTGDYTTEQDTSYKDTYKVPELYSFGNDVVSPIYLKAIWVPNDRVDVDIVHHILSLDLSKEIKTIPETLHNKRTGYLVATSGDKQNEEYILANHEELEEKLPDNLKALYKKYNDRVKANNTFFQTFKVEPEKIPDPNDSSKTIDNPKAKDNVFHFFYRPFRTRDYKVNYIDERYKAKVEDFFKGLKLIDTSGLKDDALLKANEENKKKFEDKRKVFEKLIEEYQIIAPEAVSNGNRHYDARNYRPIPGWKLVSDPQQQLFFDVNEKTNEFLGINGTGSDQIFFYYKDVRVIEVPKNGKTPDGYVRVTFKADKGGSFGKDAEGKDITELNYDVIKGLKSDLLPVPEELGTKADGTPNDKVEGKYYITPETGKKFIKWDEKPLLNNNTIVDNDKKGFYVFTAKFEWSGLSASGLVRTEAFKDPNNKWTNDFSPKIEDLKKQLVWMEKGEKKDLPAGAKIQLFDEAGNELTKDKQVYDLVNEKKKADNDELIRTVKVKAKVTFTDGKDPQELDIPIKVYKNVYEALTTGKKPLFLSEAEKGDLKDITGEYVKVTVAPTGDMSSKDNKVYYVNPKAWVDIPEVKPNGSSTLINWTADIVGQNDDKKANGKFDFAKRHKFIEETLISPRFSQTSELVAHESYKDSKNNWVNDFIDKELTKDKLKAAVQVKNGEAKALGDGDTATIVDDAGKPYADDAALKAALYEKLKEKDDGVQPSRTENIKVKVTFASGEVQTLTIPVKVIKNIYEAKTKEGKPDYVPDNYVKVTLDPTTKAKDPQKYFYYVNPDAKVLIPGKDPEGVKEDFTGWTMKADRVTGDGTSYKLKDRHQFTEDSTIIAQYGQGKAKIKYVDENDNEIDASYHIEGVDYPTEKIGKLGDNIPDSAYNQDAEKAAPKFKGYIISGISVDKNSANYTDPATATITYQYNKKVTTDDKSKSKVHFPVVFDANTGAFTGGKAKVTVYVYCDGNEKTPEPVTFEEVRDAVEGKYKKPSKANETFIEWQDKGTNGTKVKEDYTITFKDRNNGETFYAAYGKASALVKYLDLNGNPIADEFKIDGVEYPTEKAGTADEAIKSDVFTATTAPKFTGYKFNRIELNPKDGKYALKNKATIKIYYEKDSDVIPAEDGTKKPNGYVEVKFVPTNNAKDATEKTFYVNPKKDVTIPIADPVAKATFTFDKWKIGKDAKGDAYNPKTPKKFTDALTTITATYTSSKNIIPYDPSATDPMPRPEGYVRVTFAADDGLKLTEQKAYYVKKNAKNAAGKSLTLGDAELAKPAYEAQTGNKFDKWDQEDTTEIKDADIVVTAKATVLKDVDTENHPGYVKVTFKAGANGVIKENGNKIDEKVYYVNPNKYVNLPAPTPDGNTGYDFSTWKSDKSQSDFSLANFVNYTKDTTITAMFNQKEAVYPKLEGSTKPDGYVEVTFEVTGTDGKIADNEITTYYVDPSRQVSLKAPKTVAGTGYVFDKWRSGTNPTDQIIKPADQRQYTKDTTIYGSFVKLKDIIPATNDDGTPNLQPIDYVAVLFIGGDHANKLDGQFLYYVNPKAGKTIGDLTKPTVTPDTGWKHTGWDVKDTIDIKDYIFVVAEYESLDDVVPALKDDGTPNKKPDGYVTVTFKSGANGKIQENGSDITEKVYYVNPNKYVKLTAPETEGNTGFEFGSWKSDKKAFSLANYIRYEHDTTIIANFNTKNNVIPKTDDSVTKPDGFVTVNFVVEKLDGKDAGKIADSETITYFVKKGEAVTIHPPKTEAYTGYEFEKWNLDTTEAKKYATDTTVKGEFKKLDDIIPSKNPDGTVNAKPEGYVIVNFLKGDHGVLDGRTTFYVNPKAGKKLKDLDTKGITVVPSPTYKHDGWDTDFATVIDKDTNVTAKYTQLPNIIKAGPKDTAPDGYVVIIFETDGRGTITGNKAYEDKTNPKTNENEIVYFVNPKKSIKLAKLEAGAKPTADQLAVPSTTPNDPDKYTFDQWRTDIDTTTPITRGRVHIAMFKPKEVKLTYDKNGADVTGEVPPVLTVDYDADVRLAGKGNLAKKDSRFKGWKIGDKIYLAGDQINLKGDTTAYAQWTNDQNIIPYDPVNNPTTRPDDTYVRVTFAVEDGLKLTEQKAYYVKKDAGIKLGNTNLVKPGYTVETGYKLEKWDKEDTLVITEDILVTAKATKLDKAIPETKKDGTPNKKPEGYKEVVFKVKDADATKGTLEGVTKFYVKPNEYVTINPPITKAETGFEFGAWDKDATRPTVYTDDVTTIEGSFNGFKDRIPKTNPDGSENTKPDGYKTVSFEITGQGGSIVKDEVTVYYVNSAKDVTLPQPKTLAETGYEFDKWDKDTVTTAKKYTKDTIVKGNFKKLVDIIPSTDKDGKPNVQPEGYVTVTFVKGEHGTEIKGQKVYFVNPKANKTIADITKPTVKAETGWKQKATPDAWDTSDTTQITGPADIVVKAQYTELPDVIVKTADDDSQKPDGYIKVTFDTVDKGKGTIGSTIITKKVLFVNPNKSHVLRLYAPEVTRKTGYDFADWDTQIDKRIQYKDGDTIKALYNVKGDVIPQKNPNGSDRPAGYIKVLFDKGEHGRTLSGQTVYYVNPNKKVTVPAPTVNASVGYKFTDWDQKLTQKFTKDTRITAAYKPLADIVPQGKTDGSDKPYGYHTVTFKADANGALTGKTVYYVNPEKYVDLTSKAGDITKNPNVGYTAEGGTWDKGLNAKFNNDYVITFNFKVLPNVIAKTKDDESERPDGYVKVEFTSDENGRLVGGDKTYYVNPSKKVKVGSDKLPIPKTKPNANYKFDKWLENIDKNEEITTDKKYVATFKINKVTMTYKADDKTSGDVPEALSYDVGTEITLAGSVNLKKDNYVLVAWKIGDKSYLPGAKYTIKEDTVATAVWNADTHTVEFNTGGGTYIPSQKVKHNELITKVKNPEKPNYTFIGWKVDGKDFDPETDKITKDITLVAQYAKDVIPQTGTEKPKDVPNNFVEVKFVPTDKATDSTAQIFRVNPDKAVTIPVANPTGIQHFTFKEWKIGEKADGDVYTPSTAKKFTEATTITATYDEAKNIIPYNPSEPITKPEGYVRVTFEADDGLTLSNVKYYYVKKNSGVTLAKLTKPNVKPKVGFEFKNWDKENSLKIEDKDVVVKAKSTPIADAIEGKPGVEKPDGYVEVKFVAGENGTVTEKTYYVNPTKYVKLTPPTAKGNTGFEFGSWSQNAEIPTQYTEKLTTITASFNPVDSVIPKTEDGQQKPDGYVTVNFVIKGKGGQIADGETITYFVNPNEEVTIPQPKTKSEIGYEFEAWDIDTTAKAKYTKETTVTGNFRKLEDIIPSTDEKGKPNAQPEGYVTVSFDKGTNGNLIGQTSYFVNPNAGKKLEDITKPRVAPETGYKFRSWDTEDSFAIKADKTVTAQYEAIDDVIPKTKEDDSEKPAGYIKVTFYTTEKGKIKDSTAKTKAVFVNPNKALVLKGFAPEVVANKGYEFERWDASIEKPIQYNDGDTIKAIYKPGDKPGDKPGNKPGTTPAQPGGTTPGKPEKHGHRYIERVAGKNRVHTAINTSRRFFKKSRYVIIADSGNYPDALTATVLAHVLDAPILLNNTRYLEDDVAREIVRLGASEVIIVGGHKSISENVKSQLAKYDQNKVQRIWGRDRYVTSSELAYEIQRLTGKVNKAIIASGENFPDALATAPLGSKEIAPILLVKRNQMDMKVSKALKDLNIKRVYVAGGQNSVSKKLEAQLPQVIRRFNGQDRYETAILVASYTYPDSKEVFVASGEVFPDALVIGPVCAKRKAPILLSKSTPVKVTDDYIEKSKIEYLYIIGGTNTIYAETAHKYAIEE